jgi:putative phage-type endonuclease
MSVDPSLIVGSSQWHAERRRGVGGSDSAAIAGLSPWKTELQVYMEKIGEVADTEETPDMRRGTLLEPAIRQMYADETGRQVILPTKPFVNSHFRFVRANLDGLTTNDIILECKTSRNRSGWGEPGTSDIPVAYLCQVQHNMLASQKPRCDVAVLFGDFEFSIYPIEADIEFQELLLEQEAAFWECVQKRIPPEPVTTEDLMRRWPRNNVNAVVANSKDLEAARILSVVKDRIKTLEEIKDQAEMYLKASIKDAEGLHVGGDLLCTWKSAKANPRFDAKRFQVENPELFAKYLIESTPQRRFLLKEKIQCLQKNDTTILPAIPENLLTSLSPPKEQG